MQSVIMILLPLLNKLRLGGAHIEHYPQPSTFSSRFGGRHAILGIHDKHMAWPELDVTVGRAAGNLDR